MQLLNQLIQIRFERQQVPRLWLFHQVDPFTMLDMDVGWYIGAVAARFSMLLQIVGQFTVNLIACLTCPHGILFRAHVDDSRSLAL